MSRSATDSRDLVISRLLSAPAPALWRAWADPALLLVVPEALVY